MEQAILALRRFQQEAFTRHCEKIIAVATSAVREADNGGDLLQRLRRNFALDVRVISGREEARLIYLGESSPTRQQYLGSRASGSFQVTTGDASSVPPIESRWWAAPVSKK